MNMNLEGLLQLPILLFSIVIHECAHGLVASWRGDQTAREAGRVTLNLVAHIDLFGTIVFPLLLLLSGAGFLFGWAKPVPVTVSRLKDPARDHIYVSVAGPFSNILLGIAFALVYLLLGLATGGMHPSRGQLGGFAESARLMAYYGVHINALLAAFNIIPIPPLDGSWVLYRLMPAELAERYAALFPFGFIILIFLMMTGVISAILSPIYRVIWAIIAGVANLFGLIFL